MLRGRAVLAVALFIAAAFACTRKPPAEFPHVVHLTGVRCGGAGEPECLSCVSCHGGIRQDDARALPEPGACEKCHEPSEVKRLAGLVHPVAYRPPEPVGTQVIFSHREHLALPSVAGQCVGCHQGVVEPEAKTAFPPMATCLECHQEAFDEGRCTLCHTQSDLGRLEPESFMRHDAGWIRRHGMASARREELCGQCHGENECVDCHDQSQALTLVARRPDSIERGLVHRGDFMSRHPVEARSQPASCLRCHTASRCDACHVEQGISAARIGSTSPHPLGWVGPNAASRDFHGRVARRDILSCAACHDQGPMTNCIRCHSSGGFGGNPHPSGFSSMRSFGDGMCRYCHGG